jgi:mono/diheme cytochrome c family protein
MVTVQRVELFLDASPRPLAVLERAPFRFDLDAKTLAPGGHRLRLAIRYADGSLEERSHLFEVLAGEALALEDVGFVPGRGVITVDLSRELEPAGHAPRPALLVGLVVILLLLVVLGVRGFVTLGSRPVQAAAETATAAPSADEPVRAGGEAAVLDGATLYLDRCASCHQPDGRGVPGVFSPLRGAPVASADSVIDRVLHGRGAMPGFVELSDSEIAAVATHVRTAWDNGFGPVTAADVARRR